MKHLYITVHKDRLENLSFFNETKVYKKDNYYRFIYYEPATGALADISRTSQGLNTQTVELDQLKELSARGWELVRDKPTARIGKELLEFLSILDYEAIEKSRAYRPLLYDHKFIAYQFIGLHSPQDVARYVKMMYHRGYKYSDVIMSLSDMVREGEYLKNYAIRYALDLWHEHKINNIRMDKVVNGK